MIDMEQKTREMLETEAREWVEGELVFRMSQAREAIEQQAEMSEFMCGEERTRRHVREALALAEENLRNELEFEASNWIDDRIRERSRPHLEDHHLEANRC